MIPRFTEIISTQKIVDNKTRIEYDGLIDDNLLKLINEIAEKAEDNFAFDYTVDYHQINSNKLNVQDKHTRIKMDGERIIIELFSPETETYRFAYYITGITFPIREQIIENRGKEE